MRRLVIAVDCDDVLVRSTPFFIENYNRAYGTNVVVEKPEHYHDAKFWGVDDRLTLENRFGELMRSEAYRLLRPTDEEIKVLTELAQHHELHVVTARRPEERVVTQQMLDTYLPGVFTSLELVGHTGSKGEVCARLKADVLIDDNLYHLDNAIAHGLPVSGAILYGNYPWSSQDVAKGIKRCLTWVDVQKEIEDIATQ